MSRFSNRSSITSARTSNEQLEEATQNAAESNRSGSFKCSTTDVNTVQLEGPIVEDPEANYLNLIPMGAYLDIYSGEYDSFLLSYLDEDSGNYKTLCLIYREKGLYRHLEQNTVMDKPEIYDVSDMLSCDIWFEPKRPIRVRHDGVFLERNAMYDYSREPVYALKSPSFTRICNEDEVCITNPELSVFCEELFLSINQSESERSLVDVLRKSFQSIRKQSSSKLLSS
eukprot:CAMPEP_0196810324 /NCGR_PEP_ID=MMETSP1362-20130617/10142_1 /TAXON_ID=163516 /ORGANISM="Leptocylindrus danicus, Strain CCMP1856" /LENGTH=226 /DNA_ID=CAMNT_0042185259 /DNA_START=1181 /DNA_END=1861 /DNA_ORIENTATION=-